MFSKTKKRPLGAFISVWDKDSPFVLKEYGFIENGIQEQEYRGENVKIHKYKTLHTKDDDLLEDDEAYLTKGGKLYSDSANTYRSHHLDFYINEKNKLVNTDVYISEEN